jgi:hypothetical protein
MSTRLEQLTEYRRLLQARCAVERGEIEDLHADIEAGAARADRALVVVRRFAPWLLVAGVAAVVAIGPGRALGLARQGLTAALFAQRAARLFG